MIPRLAHFVFGLRPQEEPFHLLHYLAIESCRRIVQPDQIVLHVHELPYGIYWDLARPLVELERVEPVPEVEAQPLDAVLAPYRYAHHADVIRLDVLARHGGMYADIDTLFAAPFPDSLWDHEAVLGGEGDVTYDDAAGPERSLSNAMILAARGAAFIEEWRDQIRSAMDGSWSGHSCRLAARLAAQEPGRIHVEPQRSFSTFEHTPADMRALLDEPLVPGRLDGALSVHLCAHLWWGRDRRDFSGFSAVDATEAHLRTATTPLAHLAQPFLPHHGLF